MVLNIRKQKWCTHCIWRHILPRQILRVGQPNKKKKKHFNKIIKTYIKSSLTCIPRMSRKKYKFFLRSAFLNTKCSARPEIISTNKKKLPTSAKTATRMCRLICRIITLWCLIADNTSTRRPIKNNYTHMKTIFYLIHYVSLFFIIFFFSNIQI